MFSREWRCSWSSADGRYMQTNIHNWMCVQYTSNLFPFNQIEDDNDFVLACCIQPCNELLSSDLIYDPFGSDREDIDNQNEFDPDQNFIMNKICSMVSPAVVTSFILWKIEIMCPWAFTVFFIMSYQYTQYQCKPLAFWKLSPTFIHWFSCYCHHWNMAYWYYLWFIFLNWIQFYWAAP